MDLGYDFDQNRLEVISSTERILVSPLSSPIIMTDSLPFGNN